jgi:rare lipoprotein A
VTTYVRALSFVAIAACVALSGCASKSPSAPSKTSAATRSGVYYKDDGPPTALPSDLDRIADATPSDEPLHRFANRPYNVFGVNYTPMTMLAPLKQRGIASWYGKKFHGQKTAIGETYDMFAMSAAHPTAPLPSYARVTSVRSGKSAIVRINDRGPFHVGRIVDLSYAAAHRIGVAQAGSGEVEFELLLPPRFAASPIETVSRAEAVVRAEAAARVAPAPANAPSANAATSANVDSSGGGDKGSVSAESRVAPLNQANQQFFVQLGAFGNFGNAQAFQGRVSDELGTVPIVRQAGGLFRVQLGPFASLTDAQNARQTAQLRLGASLPIVTEMQKQ